MNRSELLVRSLAVSTLLALGACAYPDSEPIKPTPTTPIVEGKHLSYQGGEVEISADGCRVIAHGLTGAKVVIGSSLGNKGGDQAYPFTSTDAAVSESTGGVKGGTGYGELYDAAGQIVGTVTEQITVDQCPPAGA